MTVTTWTLHLHWKRHTEIQTDRTLNADDEGVLRETLEQLVTERMGDKHRENLEHWSMLVLVPKTHRLKARVSIDAAGRTQVDR